MWLLLRRFRGAAAQAAGKSLADIPEPGTVDYARSFFPVALVVLVRWGRFASRWQVSTASSTPQ